MGMKYSVGSRFNFTMAAGVGEVVKMVVGKAGVLSGLNVGGAAFRFCMQTVDGVVTEAQVEHGEEVGALYLHLPAADAGVYRYELDFTDSQGEYGVLLYGDLTVISRAGARALVDGARAAELRLLEVMAGGLHAGSLELRWAASSVAGRFAADAGTAAERAEEAAGRVEGVEVEMKETLEAVLRFMESFNKALREAIQVVDNYLYVGGVNTGHYLKGQDGVTPHIGTDGYWYVGTKRLGDRPAFGKDGITPHITADGFWAFGETKTTVRAEGRDGIDGSAVRFIIVGSVEELPQEGETCNGGFRYLVKKEGWSLIGEEDAPSSGEWEAWEMPSYLLPSEFTHLRVPGALNANDVPAYLMVRTAAGEVLGVSANAVCWAVGDVVTWEFEQPVQIPNGAVVQMFLRPTNEGISGAVPNERILMKSVYGAGVCRVRYHAVWYGERAPYLLAYGAGAAEFYDVYAWVECAGVAGWVRVSRSNDLATSRVYGVMKYATDMTVVDGAPVGQNAQGQASVPLADAALPGSVMPASAEVESEGGQTFMRDGRMYVRMANLDLPGVGKTSYTQVVENTNSVGLTEDGKFSVPRAAAFHWGVCKVGSSVPQSNGMPWIIPVGAAADGILNEHGQDITGQLMNNVLVGGALRTAVKSTWLSWGPNGINVDFLPEGGNAVGLMTSRSFRQSADEGLVLEYATESLVGGVRICTSIGTGAGGSQAVPTSSAVVQFLLDNYYKKAQVVTPEGLTKALEGYLSVQAATNAHKAFAGKDELQKLSDDVVHVGGDYLRGEVMPSAEYDALGDALDEKKVYILV